MFAEITLQNGIGWAAMIVIAGYLWLRTKQQPLASSRTSFAKPAEPLAAERTTEPVEMLRWQVEMHETARDLKAEIDSKMVALQILIRDARQEQERLATLLARAEQIPTDASARHQPPSL
jgi:hypothetical protein